MIMSEQLTAAALGGSLVLIFAKIKNKKMKTYLLDRKIEAGVIQWLDEPSVSSQCERSKDNITNTKQQVTAKAS